jgi:hypothetical protein
MHADDPIVRRAPDCDAASAALIGDQITSSVDNEKIC